jgi:DNA mismatch repair protein MutS
MDYEKLTPAQKQYMDLRNQYPDCILFFRMGDFYETFYEDAKVCSKLLDLTLTARDKQWHNPIPMAWAPYHAADKYIAKLVAHGYKVAIAEQMTEAKAWQIVERKVTQVITPATFIEESKKEFTYIVGLAYVSGEHDPYQCSRWDVTVWSYRTHSFKTLEETLQHIARIQPRELVVDIDFPESIAVRDQIAQSTTCLVSIYDKPADSDAMLRHVFGVQTLASFGKALEAGRQYAMALLCNYLHHIQPHSLQTIVRIQYDAKNDDVMLDMVTVRNLEILTSQYEWSKKYWLLWVLDTTATALGARLLREVILHPIQNLDVIKNRQSHISDYTQRSWDAKHVQEVLRQMVDMPKIVSTILYKKSAPTNFWKLRYALELVHRWITIRHPEWHEGSHQTTSISLDSSAVPQNDGVLHSELLKIWLSKDVLDQTIGYYAYLNQLLKYDWLNDDIDYINDGYNTEIDELRKIAYHSDSLLLEYQQELVQKTGVANVKVKYVSNQWYILEVTPKDMDAFEAASVKWDAKFELIRRQTLKTGQRYTTVYLDELQHKVLAAQFQLRSREQELIQEAKDRLVSIVNALWQLADGIAWLDIYTSHALFAKEKKYVKPELVVDGMLEIVWGRHPVIEEYLPHDQDFIPNDLRIGICHSEATPKNLESISLQWQTSETLDPSFHSGWQESDSWLLHIITWPNMWWKSTFLRQNALIVLMAHCGFSVPAEKAIIPLIDGLFARVWSGDVIAKNQSTFMTEMIEMANILHNATKRSFVILDELGRGTSTYDGMALAHAIVQYIVQHIGVKTLFATHYHELIALEQSLSWVKNYSVSVYETDKDVVFMKKIIAWWASKSYGLDVAKLAGIPSAIVDTARKYLNFHETNNVSDSTVIASNSSVIACEAKQSMPLFNMEVDRESIWAKTQLDKIKRLLDTLDPNNMTPMQALQMIAKLKGEI